MVEPPSPPSPPSPPPPTMPSWQPPPDVAVAPQDWRRSAGPLPGSVVAAAVIVLVMAVLTGLFGALMLFSASVVTDPAFIEPLTRDPAFGGQSPEAGMAMAQGILYAFAGIILLVAVLHLVAGIGTLRRRNWARITAMVLAGLGIVLTGVSAGVSLLSAGQPPPPGFESGGLTAEQYSAMITSGMILFVGVSVVVLLAYGYVFFVLLARGSAFSPTQTRAY